MTACEDVLGDPTTRQTGSKNHNPTKKVNSGFKAILAEYCETSCLHCFKYLVQSNRSITERVCWALAILTSLVCCSVPISQVWQKWNTSPVIVTFAENSSPIASLPFPTVTVCSSIKYRSEYFDYVQMSSKPREELLDEERDKLDSINLVCDEDIFFPGEEYSYFINDSTVEYIEQVAPSLSESLYCQYNVLDESECINYMDPVVTDEGLCFTFNALPNNAIYTPITVQYGQDSKDYEPIWTPEKGYLNKTSSLEVKPYRAFNVDIWDGLILVLQFNGSEQDFNCYYIQGYKIALTSPANSVAEVDSGYYLPSSGLTQIAISPVVMDTSEDLRHYSSSERHCLYPNERQLEFYQMYTQENCYAECFTKFTLKRCGCVAYYMPRVNGTPICGPRSKECLRYASIELNKQEIDSIIQEDKFNACACLPGCTTIKYTADIYQTNDGVEHLIRGNLSDYIKSQNLSTNIVLLYFRESEFLASRRGELYGYGSFIAQCGGLLGLCCGFSLLSLVEIVYFTFIRMWTDNYKQDKARKLQNNQISDIQNNSTLNYY